ncbi:MAG TPA: hypothetical protein VGG72_13505 [Bryobacteraceae bacterium]|jgi:hypothetical protein
MRKHFAISAGTAAVAVIVSLVVAPSPARSQQPAAQAKGKGPGRAAPPPGPSGPTPHMPDGKPDFTGIWNGQRTVSQDGPYLQPWAQKLLDQRETNHYADDFEARCLPGGPPRAAPYHTALVSTPKLVLMLFEGNTHMFRQFFLDGTDHPKDLKPTWYGDSRAHWDGETLVVDTIGFNDKSWIDMPGHPHTSQMHLTERFSRPNLGTLNIGITIDDPGAYTKPWIQSRTATLETSIEMTEYVCNENNQDPVHLDGAHK